ncbi:hypothetical protein V6N12_075280 [Hibiscus sabdariffa]|uniref:Uncharacterized protein n=1 Tax=Hibiscus sabdariffa TaxID=183260 RepID=A0ABR2C7T5_9ROSI
MVEQSFCPPSFLLQVKTMLSQAKTMLRGSERGGSTLPDDFLENWVVSEKQRPNGRFDKALPWDNKVDPSISTVPSTLVVLEGVVEATSCAIEEVPISFILASTQDNVPIYPDLNQDNAPPSQDNAQWTRRRRSRSSLLDEFLENLFVSEKERPNERVDKALPQEGKADPSISTVPSTSVVPEDKPNGKKETEDMKSSNDESDFDLNDLVAFSTIIDRYENE